MKEATKEYAEKGEIKFYDSNTGNLLFIAPKGRSFDEFINESMSHGWPSFRDDEVVWDDVRCLPNGEAVSLVGTHLGVSFMLLGYVFSIRLKASFSHMNCFSILIFANFRTGSTSKLKMMSSHFLRLIVPQHILTCALSLTLFNSLPDFSGNRYCINLVSVAGNPVGIKAE